MTHELKTLNPYFTAVWDGLKDFELRKHDRDFNVGDTVKLIEFDLTVKQPRFIIKKIKYILGGGAFGLDSEYCILGLSD